MKVTPLQYAKTFLELTAGKSEQEISEIAKTFAVQLQKDGQLKNADAIMQKFTELWNKENGIVAAEVMSREEIDQEMKVKIEKFVKEKYQAKEVEIENIVNPSIKGGVIIRVGDEILDASIDSQLKLLRKELTK